MIHYDLGKHGRFCPTLKPNGSGSVSRLNTDLEHGESQRVTQSVFVGDEGPSASALHVDAGQGVQLGVDPVEPAVRQVCGGIGGRQVRAEPPQKPGQRTRGPILPRVMPFGHTMSSVTTALRSPPFRPPLSIRAGLPQSAQ